MPRHVVLGLALALAAAPALADSQSTNTSTNCSNGFCTRTESVVIEDRYGRRGFVRTDAWDEQERHRRWRGPPRGAHGAPPVVVIIPPSGALFGW